MNTLSVNKVTKGIFTVDSSNIIKADKYIDYLENRILAKSNHYNLMDKFTTGFGWSRNLHALYWNQLVTYSLANNIFKTHDFFINLYKERKIHTDIWNEFVEIQHNIVNALN